jgi:VanZ family protein
MSRSLRALRIVAWLLLGFIVLATLAPISMRPISPFGANTERFAAFLLVSAAFACAYPRHVVRIGILVVLAAAGLELVQHFEPTRHGEVRDLLIKIAGAAIGLGVGRLLTLGALALRQQGQKR